MTSAVAPTTADDLFEPEPLTGLEPEGSDFSDGEGSQSSDGGCGGGKASSVSSLSSFSSDDDDTPALKTSAVPRHAPVHKGSALAKPVTAAPTSPKRSTKGSPIQATLGSTLAKVEWDDPRVASEDKTTAKRSVFSWHNSVAVVNKDSENTTPIVIKHHYFVKMCGAIWRVLDIINNPVIRAVMVRAVRVIPTTKMTDAPAEFAHTQDGKQRLAQTNQYINIPKKDLCDCIPIDVACTDGDDAVPDATPTPAKASTYVFTGDCYAIATRDGTSIPSAKISGPLGVAIKHSLSTQTSSTATTSPSKKGLPEYTFTWADATDAKQWPAFATANCLNHPPVPCLVHTEPGYEPNRRTNSARQAKQASKSSSSSKHAHASESGSGSESSSSAEEVAPKKKSHKNKPTAPEAKEGTHHSKKRKNTDDEEVPSVPHHKHHSDEKKKKTAKPTEAPQLKKKKKHSKDSESEASAQSSDDSDAKATATPVISKQMATAKMAALRNFEKILKVESHLSRPKYTAIIKGVFQTAATVNLSVGGIVRCMRLVADGIVDEIAK